MRALSLRLLGWALRLAAVAAVLVGGRLVGEDATLDIGVRAMIEQPKWKRPKPGTKEAAEAEKKNRIFILAPPQQLPSERKLVRPVDTRPLIEQLWHELLAQGFQPAAPGQTPEIIITMHYGRGYLWNPYLAEYASSVDETTTVPTVNIVFPPISAKEFGREEKTQRAQYEKLVLMVAAWEWFPQDTGKKHKAKRLWRTAMVVDDPDHRDLNQISAQLLKAGAGYFNREVKNEAEVKVALREGRVEVGEARVVDSPAQENAADGKK